MLLLYKKETGRITGINTSSTATFNNMYPNVPEEFKQKYGGIVVDYDHDYDINRNWYKVENGEIVKLESPFIDGDTLPKIPDSRDQEIADLKSTITDLEKVLVESQKVTSDLEMAVAAILGGAV